MIGKQFGGLSADVVIDVDRQSCSIALRSLGAELDVYRPVSVLQDSGGWGRAARPRRVSDQRVVSSVVDGRRPILPAAGASHFRRRRLSISTTREKAMAK